MVSHTEIIDTIYYAVVYSIYAEMPQALLITACEPQPCMLNLSGDFEF